MKPINQLSLFILAGFFLRAKMSHPATTISRDKMIGYANLNIMALTSGVAYCSVPDVCFPGRGSFHGCRQKLFEPRHLFLLTWVRHRRI